MGPRWLRLLRFQECHKNFWRHCCNEKMKDVDFEDLLGLASLDPSSGRRARPGSATRLPSLPLLVRVFGSKSKKLVVNIVAKIRHVGISHKINWVGLAVVTGGKQQERDGSTIVCLGQAEREMSGGTNTGWLANVSITTAAVRGHRNRSISFLVFEFPRSTQSWEQWTCG